MREPQNAQILLKAWVKGPGFRRSTTAFDMRLRQAAPVLLQPREAEDFCAYWRLQFAQA